MNKIYIDFEMNMPESKHKRDIDQADIIAIGAIKYNVKHNNISEFKSLIKPVSNNKIYEHIQNLTGIKDEDLVDAPSYEEVMRKFKVWLGDFEQIDGIYTFGNLDLTCFLSTDRRSAKKYNHPRFVNNIRNFFVDIKEKYMQQGIKCVNYVSLKNLLEHLNVEFNGIAHDPLYDAYNLFILDETLDTKDEIKKMLTVKDVVRNPFTEMNEYLQECFEQYRKAIYDNNDVKFAIDNISIEVLKTLRTYLISLRTVDIYNIEIIKDINRKINTFTPIKDIDEGCFYLLENVYLDMKDLLEDLMTYKLSQNQYEEEINKIIQMFEDDMYYENIDYEIKDSNILWQTDSVQC